MAMALKATAGISDSNPSSSAVDEELEDAVGIMEDAVDTSTMEEEVKEEEEEEEEEEEVLRPPLEADKDEEGSDAVRKKTMNEECVKLIAVTENHSSMVQKMRHERSPFPIESGSKLVSDRSNELY